MRSHQGSRPMLASQIQILLSPGIPSICENEIRAIDKSPSIRKPFTSSPAAEYRLHEEIAADYSDMIMRRRGTPQSTASGGSSTAPSRTAWRKPATVCSPSPACRRANGAARGRRMQLSACTRSSHEGSKHSQCCRVQIPPPCCSGVACLGTDQHAQSRWLADARHQADRSAI